MRRNNKFQLLKILAVGAALLMLVVSVATWLDQPYSVEIDELPHEIATTSKEVNSPPESTRKRHGPPPHVLIQNKYSGIILKKFTYYKDNMNKQVMLYQMSDQEKADYAKDHFNVTQHKKHAVHDGASKRRKRPEKAQQHYDSNEGGEVVDEDEDQPNQHARQYDDESEGEREDYDDDDAAEKLAQLHPKTIQHLNPKGNQKNERKTPVNQARQHVKPALRGKRLPVKKQAPPSKKGPKSGHLKKLNVKKTIENEDDDTNHLEEDEDPEEVEEANANESKIVQKSQDPRKAPQKKVATQTETHKIVPKKDVENVKEQPKNYKIEPRIDQSQKKNQDHMISPETKKGRM